MELQGNGRPLVFLDAAVIVGPQVRQLRVLIQGQLLEVQAGTVDVGRADDTALRQGPAPPYRQEQGFPAVNIIYLLSGLQAGEIRSQRTKARRLRQLHRLPDRLPLGAGVIQKAHIPPTVVLTGQKLVGIHPVIPVFRLVHQLFFQFIHVYVSSKMFENTSSQRRR